MGIGVWLTVSYDTYARILPSYHVLSADNLAIIAGCLTFLIAFCGCCGAWFQSKCLLTTYLVMIVIVMLLEITAGTLSFAFRRQLGDTLRKELLDGIRDRYEVNDTNGMVTTWDAIQEQFNCCGVNNYTDWYKISAWPNNDWVPSSCCIPKTKNFTSSFDQDGFLRDIEANEEPDTCGKDERDVERYRKHGCYIKIRNFILKHLHVVGLTSIVFAFIQFFSVVGALLIVCTIDYRKRSRPLMHHNSRPTYNRVPTL